ncbi:hypothetical protein LR013_04245 [candidate division NPL-UPA2 bacterium]|nr:hypothetical protein [candidate division NPL-UPA2 bacterium]
MRKRIFSLLSPRVGLGTVALFLFLTVSALAAARSVTIKTKGGEIFIGEFAAEKLKILHLGQEFELPVAEITEISEDLSLFRLGERMLLRGKIIPENLVIRTRFGDINVPVADIKTIKLEAPAGAAPAVAFPKRCPHCGRLIKAEAIPQEATAGDWKVRVKREIRRGHKVKFTLQYVERRGDNLIVGIGFRNITERVVPVQLPKNFQESTLLLDDQVGTEYRIRRIRGLSVERLNIAPGAMRVAHFTFPFPEGVEKARLTSMLTIEWGSSPLSVAFTIPPQAVPEAGG